MRQNISASIGAAAALLLTSATLATVGIGPAGAAPKGSPWGATYFPNVPLVTQEGTPVRFYDDLIKDKLVVIHFLYTHCQDACSLETARLAQVQQLLGDRMGREIFIYSITIDPTRDTPPVLKRYAHTFHAGPGWVFLTGKKEDIALLRKKLGLYSEKDRDHTSNLMLGNEATGQWMRHTALEDPQYLAVIIGDWLSNWKERNAVKSYAEAPRLPVPEKGQYLFQSRCASCHTLGKGDGLGPDLLGVTSRRDRAWLARWLAVPDQMLAERDPTATELFARYKNVPMPNLRLSETDVAALIAYMEARSTALQGTDRKDSLAAR